MSLPPNAVRSQVSQSPQKRLVVSLHDVHEGSLPKIEQQLRWCSRLGVGRVTLLAVPNFHGRGVLKPKAPCADFLCQAQDLGHEVALHGFYHSSDYALTGIDSHSRQGFHERFYTSNEAEFFRLDSNEASQLLERGMSVLRACGLEPQGFVAPAWLLSTRARQAVFEAGFRWTCTVDSVLVRHGVVVQSRSLCWSVRARWRRVVSVAWNELLFALCRCRDVVRVSLHPLDLEHRTINAQIAQVLSAALEGGYTPVTYSDVAAGAEA